MVRYSQALGVVLKGLTMDFLHQIKPRTCKVVARGEDL